MKHILLAFFFSFTCLVASAQKDVYLKIDHFLGNNAFAYNTQSSNNLGNQFRVTRLEYYIAEIQLVHDGGQNTVVPNKWILVDAGTGVNEMLGNFNITTLEAIKFTVGVEPAVNHSDPSSYPSGHPLAPKLPSMHWGWTAGYRFVALEGESGNSFNQIFEFHALGDVNYFPLTLNTAGMESGNMITVQVNADYNKALMNIDVSSGNIVHGETGDAITTLLNFNQNVFTSAEGNGTLSIEEPTKTDYSIYPNPSKGKITLALEEENTEDYSITITDILGNKIFQLTELDQQKLSLNIDIAGVYFITLVNNKNGQTSTKRLTIAH